MWVLALSENTVVGKEKEGHHFVPVLHHHHHHHNTRYSIKTCIQTLLERIVGILSRDVFVRNSGHQGGSPAGKKYSQLMFMPKGGR